MLPSGNEEEVNSGSHCSLCALYRRFQTHIFSQLMELAPILCDLNKVCMVERIFDYILECAHFVLCVKVL